jgi:hypothetical protein
MRIWRWKMMRWFCCSVLVVVVCLAPTLAPADALGDAKTVLCTASIATICLDDGECETGPPWNWNIPQFIEVHLDAKQLRTTRASGENRATAIRNMVREDGQIYLQGVEMGRAFSFVISEGTGDASFAVAREGLTVGAFGACTPIEGRR